MDRYGRTVARVECDGTDASAAQVRAGMAWAFLRYAPIGSDLYRIECGAKANGVGRGRTLIRSRRGSGETRSDPVRLPETLPGSAINASHLRRDDAATNRSASPNEVTRLASSATPALMIPTAIANPVATTAAQITIRADNADALSLLYGSRPST